MLFVMVKTIYFFPKIYRHIRSNVIQGLSQLFSGGTGTQTRAKTCIEPVNGGQACPDQSRVEESKSCDAPACWSDWGLWSVSGSQ